MLASESSVRVRENRRLAEPARSESGLADATVVAEFAGTSPRSLPRIQRGQVRRFQCPDQVLDRCQIGHARPNLAVGPRAGGEPFNQVVTVLALAQPVMAQLTLGLPCSARIGKHNGVPERAPISGVGSLECP